VAPPLLPPPQRKNKEETNTQAPSQQPFDGMGSDSLCDRIDMVPALVVWGVIPFVTE